MVFSLSILGYVRFRYKQRRRQVLLMTMLRNLLSDETGATAIEYGLIAALIAVAAVTVMGTVGTNLSGTFNTVANAL